MNAVSLRVDVTELSGRACDRLMSHILRTALPKGAKAQVIERSGEPIETSEMGSLPTITTGFVTTSYAVESLRAPEIDGDTAGVVDL